MWDLLLGTLAGYGSKEAWHWDGMGAREQDKIYCGGLNNYQYCGPIFLIWIGYKHFGNYFGLYITQRMV